MAEFQRAGLALWLPFFVGAHIFAAFWLLKSLSTLSPELWKRLTDMFAFCNGAAGRGPPGDRRRAEVARSAAPCVLQGGCAIRDGCMRSTQQAAAGAPCSIVVYRSLLVCRHGSNPASARVHAAGGGGGGNHR